MALPELLSEYGYLAVFAGSLLEGETILILAGYAAHRGYLSLPGVMLVAFCGGTLGDQIFFFVGLRRGDALLRRMPWLHRRADRVKDLLLRHHAGLIVGIRFMYGLRIVGPIAIGMSDVRPRRFLAFNLIGAAIWSVLIAGIGFVFGKSMQMLLARFEQYELLGALAIVGVAGIVAAAHLWRSRRQAHRSKRP